MKRQISSPYNFVPLNQEVYYPDWQEQVSQDIPFSDGEDGWIEVRWRNVSPLFIRDASEHPGEKERNVHSMHVVQPDGTRRYFIPGSSMKGMLRAVLAVLSFGKMGEYNDRHFGHREFDTRIKEGKSYQEKMQRVSYGWLAKDEDDIYWLTPCKGPTQKILISEVSKHYPGYETKKSAWERNKAIADNTFPITTHDDGNDYHIVATGAMHNKKHELLYPVEEDAQQKVPDKVIDSFLTVYSTTPDFEHYVKMLEQGKRIPVSYLREKGDVSVIGMGRMLRDPYKYSIKDLVERDQRTDSRHDLCETIFGWAEKDSQMKGRVQIGNAFATKSIADNQLKSESGILGEPKPSFYPLYIRQDASPYKTYNDADAHISGRKRYRIHKGNTTTQPPQNKENENVTSKMMPVPAGQDFVMRINVHNLRKAETGALLCAITLNHTPGVWHNIGGAKGFGYGKIECCSVTLHRLAFTEEEYLRAFEKEMHAFTESVSMAWNSSEPLRSLVALMSEHDEGQLRMMEMENKKLPNKEKNEYLYFSKKENFSQLKEVPRDFRSVLTDADKEEIEARIKERAEAERKRKAAERKEKFKQKHEKDYKDLADKIQEQDFTGAIRCLDSIIDTMRIEQIDSKDEEKLKQKIIAEKEKAEIEKAQREKEEALKKKEELLNAGLSATLDERFDNGNYKVPKWKTCLSKVGQWLKKKGASSLDEAETVALKATVHRLITSPDKADKKAWPNFGSKNWKEIADLTSEETAKAWFDEMTGE